MKKFNISGVSKLPQVEIAYGYADASPIVFNALVDEGVGELFAQEWRMVIYRIKQ